MGNKHTIEIAQKKIDKYATRFTILEYVPGDLKSTILDTSRDVTFQYRTNQLIQKLKKNPDLVPNPTPAEKALAYKRGHQKRCAIAQEKHGVDHFSKRPDVKARRKKTFLRLYGVGSNVERPDVLKRSRKACSTPEALRKGQATIVKRYGSLAHPDIRKKKILTSQRRYGYDYPSMSPEIKAKIVATRIANGNCHLINGVTMKELASSRGLSVSHANKLRRTLGEELVKKYTHSQTSLEQYVRCLLPNDLVVIYDRKLEGTSYRPDFVIPEHKLIIECDGLYWHSDAVQDDKKYHQNKKSAYTAAGYKSLFFHKDEIVNQPDAVRAIIENALGLNIRVFARKCSIEETNYDFIKRHHLMGKGAGKCYSLIHEEKTVSSIQVKWVKKLDKSLEISRFCSAPGTTVVGGFSKLINHIEKLYTPKSITTFIDNRYGTGEYLSALGFTRKTSYLSFKWTDFENVFNRMQYKGQSGYGHGLFKIWDCGQIKWVK